MYERAADKGRMLPEGLSYVDLVEFDIVPVIDSREAGTRAFTKASDPEQGDQV